MATLAIACPRDAAQVAALLDSPEIAGLISELEATCIGNVITALHVENRPPRALSGRTGTT